MYDWIGTNFAKVAEGTSVAPRRRAVFGVPAFINMALLPWANAVKYAVMRTPWTAHANELATLEDFEFARRECGGGALLASDDISGFDLHVRRIHQESIARHIYSRFWPPHVIDLWLGAQQMPILGPPISSSARGFLYTRERGGVTTSGVITTSLDGTLINLARVVTAYAAASRKSVGTAWADLLAHKWTVKVWGDDTALITPGTFDAQAYETASAAIGYTAQIQPGLTFLMKHYDLSRRAVYPLATRILQQTFFNEAAGRSEEIELLGLFARTVGLEANPYGALAWRLVTTDAPTLDRHNIRTRGDLRHVMSDPAFQARLAVAIKDSPSTIAGWLAKADRGSAEDEALVGWLTYILGEDATGVARMDVTGLLRLPQADAQTLLGPLATWLASDSDARTKRPKNSALIETHLTTTQENDDATATDG